MKIKNKCPDCNKDNLSEILGNKLLFTTKCPSGHEYNVLIKDDTLSAVLFDNACLAIHNDCYRAAVLDFQSSLEKLWEEHIRFHLITINSPNERINLLDNLMKKNSHIKEGAFYMLHTINNNDLRDKKFNEKREEMRNNVFHKGYVPTKEDAIDFGQKTLMLISDIMHNPDKEYYLKLQKNNFDHQMALDKKETTDCFSDKKLQTKSIGMSSFKTIMFKGNNLVISDIITSVVDFWKNIL
jgi:hypothetical protein